MRYTRTQKRAVQAQLRAFYDHHYSLDNGVGEGICFYCHWPSTTIDHCPPISWIDVHGIGYFEEYGIRLVKVHCCWPCNGALGSRKLFYLEDRRAYLKKYYQNKYESLLTVPAWHVVEIDELRGNLRRKVVDAVQAKRILEERLIALGV